MILVCQARTNIYFMTSLTHEDFIEFIEDGIKGLDARRSGVNLDGMIMGWVCSYSTIQELINWCEPRGHIFKEVNK